MLVPPVQSALPTLAGRVAPLVALFLVFTSLVLPQPIRAEEGTDNKPSVTVVIDYGDGVQKRISLPWKEKQTVLGALEAAARHPRGIKFKHRGKGETAFVMSIDDCENEGAGRNWTYQVNDKRATKSCGIQAIESGDVVLWKFADGR